MSTPATLVLVRRVALATASVMLIACAEPIAPPSGSHLDGLPSPAASWPDYVATAQVANDSFNRLALGTNWDREYGWAAGIVGGQDFGALSTGPLSVQWAATEFAADQFSEVVIAIGKDPNIVVQAHVRWQSDKRGRYGFHYNPESVPGAWELKLDGVLRADTRTLASTPGAAPIAGDVIRIEARGRDISGYVNGRRLLVATDSAPNAIFGTGKVGITARSRTGSIVRYPAPIVSNWRGGSLDPSPCADGRDTTKVAINDLGRGCYLSYQGGLYPEGANTLSGAHLRAGIAAAAQIAPLDVNGQPSAKGRYVLLSVGMSNTTQEFCSGTGLPRTCQWPSFVAQAGADTTVRRAPLAIVDGAYGGRTATAWTSASSPEFDRIRDTWLTPLGLSEKQVQIAWIKVANRYPNANLPSPNADAFALERQLGQINRALKARYPNLRQIFVSSRIYGGFATIALNPEPYAYETGFAVKWAIEAQVTQMETGVIDDRAGDLRFDNGVAAWMAWGPYPWANGTRARSDGLSWRLTDFRDDGTHPAMPGRQKVGAMLLDFFKTSPVTDCWFLAGRACR